MKCQLCNSNNLYVIYGVDDVPIFQNKVYDTEEEARKASLGTVSLSACSECGFVFNSDFNSDLMDYDEQYQNEVGYSTYFNSHIESVIDLLVRRGFKEKRIVEIGCGKGYFLGKLVERGFDVIGFDPAYEGDNPKIIKDYFTDKYHLNADLIILRHVIEHIPRPLDMLHAIAKANNYSGTIYIETPSFDWIVKNDMFFDIFHEHCNYFSPASMSNMFTESEIVPLFGGQYMGVFAGVKDLAEKAHCFPGKEYPSDIFQGCLAKYKNFVSGHSGVVIYGGGAKGITFANMMDPYGMHISCLVDINPKKQNKYIPKTVHKIVSLNQLKKMTFCDIIIMNRNYLEEIKESLGDTLFNLYTVEEIDGSN